MSVDDATTEVVLKPDPPKDTVRLLQWDSTSSSDDENPVSYIVKLLLMLISQ